MGVTECDVCFDVLLCRGYLLRSAFEAAVEDVESFPKTILLKFENVIMTTVTLSRVRRTREFFIMY